MFILHLIMQNNCKHTVFVEENKKLEAIPTAMQHLTLEAGGLAAEVVVCNSDNMPLSYHTINGSNDDENPWTWMVLGILLAAILLPWFLSLIP